MDDTVLMGTTSSITMQSLEKIVHRVLAVGAKMCFFCYRQDCHVAANCRYCFYSQAKNQVFRPAGATRCTDSGQPLHDRRARGSAWLCKMSRQFDVERWECGPKNMKKKIHFLVNSRPSGVITLTDFENF